jgi:hypothetical protein
MPLADHDEVQLRATGGGLTLVCPGLSGRGRAVDSAVGEYTFGDTATTKITITPIRVRSSVAGCIISRTMHTMRPKQLPTGAKIEPRRRRAHMTSSGLR